MAGTGEINYPVGNKTIRAVLQVDIGLSRDTGRKS